MGDLTVAFRKASGVGSKFVSYASDFQWQGGKVTAAVARGGARGLNRAAELLKALSVPLAPLDRGPLRESATVKQASLGVLESALIFDTPYAATQHEHTEFHHDDGQAKYVEQPAREHKSDMDRIIAQEIAQEIKVIS